MNSQPKNPLAPETHTLKLHGDPTPDIETAVCEVRLFAKEHKLTYQEVRDVFNEGLRQRAIESAAFQRYGSNGYLSTIFVGEKGAEIVTLPNGARILPTVGSKAIPIAEVPTDGEELRRFKEFRWNVLQAYDRGGDAYLRNTVDWLVEHQALDIPTILGEV